jgi:hypothetical protein
MEPSLILAEYGNYDVRPLRCGRLLCVMAAIAIVTQGCRGGTMSSPSGPDPIGRTVATVSGTVTDRTSGARLSNVLVAVQDGPNARLFTTTDPSGNYSLVNLAGGTFGLTASTVGYVASTLFVNLGSDMRADFAVTRTPTAPAAVLAQSSP